jgi:hypothetical protein
MVTSLPQSSNAAGAGSRCAERGIDMLPRSQPRLELEALVVTDATKKLREPVAYLLLAFVGVYALASVLGLFVGDEFTSAARVVQGNLAAPGISGIALLLALVAAVFLVTEFGERTPNARIVTLAALVLAGLLSLILVIAAIAGFSNDGDALPKIVGFLYDLGGLALYALVGFLILRTFQALPAPVKAVGAHGQYAGQPQFGAQQGGYDAGQYGGGQYGGQPYAGQQGQYGDAGQAQYGDAGQQGQYGDVGQAQYGGQYGGQYGDAGQGQYGGQYGGYAAQQGSEPAATDQGSWSYGSDSGADSGAESGTPQSQDAGQQWGSQQADAGEQQQWSQGGDTQQWPPASESSPSQASSSQWGQDSGQQWSQDPGQQQWGQQQSWGQESQPSPGWEQPANAGGGVPSWTDSESAGSADADRDALDTPDTADDEAKPAESADARDAEDSDGQSQSAKKDEGQQGWWSQPPQ